MSYGTIFYETITFVKTKQLASHALFPERRFHQTVGICSACNKFLSEVTRRDSLMTAVARIILSAGSLLTSSEKPNAVSTISGLIDITSISCGFHILIARHSGLPFPHFLFLKLFSFPLSNRPIFS